ncbi:MAG: hypothetical protein IH820_13175 [Bacteroidetes bacterium]|nr:hypothetical protein [Bacteroidota bacterium]
MPNTLVAILALVGSMLLVLGQQQVLERDRADMIKDELEIMASGIALQVMEHIAMFPFDEATADADFDPETFSVTDLAALPFVQQGSVPMEFDDARYLEDFHQVQIDTLEFKVGEMSMPFSVDLEVYYIDDDKNWIDARTRNKEVRVSISHERYPSALVVLRRSFAP